MKIIKRFAPILTIIILLVSLYVPVVRAEENDVTTFVNRMYKTCLGREADNEGRNYWLNELVSGRINGTDIAKGFVYSPEFQNKGLSDSEFLDAMYEAFFGRPADDSGKNYWLSVLAAGNSRDVVFSGFVNSNEFCNLCDIYGIACSSSCKKIQNAKVKQFVERMYETGLGRQGEAAGVDFWVSKLTNKEIDGVSVAYSFMFSPEYKSKSKSNEEYIKDLYVALMGRTFDQDGLNYWLGIVGSGYSREHIFNCFANSAEFTSICSDYGITRGYANYSMIYSTSAPTPTSIPTPTVGKTHTKEEWMQIQGVSEFKTTDGIVVYGKFVDTTPLDEAVNNYRISQGWTPYEVITGQDNVYSIYQINVGAWTGTVKQAAIDSCYKSNKYFHILVNNVTYSGIINPITGNIDAFNSLKNSPDHFVCWNYAYVDYRVDNLGQRFVTQMESASYQMWVYEGDDKGFASTGSTTVQYFPSRYL